MGRPSTVSSASTTFTVPKHLIDNQSTTLLDLYDWNAIHNANSPLFRCLTAGIIKTISWAEANEATHRAAAFFSSKLKVATEDSRPVLAILASADAITYFCSIVGILRAGFTVFPISHRNGPEALASLLTRTKARVIVTSMEPGIQEVANSAIKMVLSSASSDNAEELSKTHVMPTFEELFPSHRILAPHNAPYKPWGLEDQALIMHSSGSTAFPKPIVWSVRGFMQWALTPCFGEIDLNGVVISCHALPMFHAMGILQIASSAVCGSVMATFEPSTPPTFPTAENVFHGAKDTHSDMVCCVPAFVEQWATEPAKVEHLKTLKGVIFGGAPLLKDVGDRLASEGVCLYSLYGSTELGIMAPYFPANPGLDWDWVTISKQMRPVFVPYGDGTFELVMTVHGNWRPAIVDTTIDGREAYATKDLFIPHPNKPGMWKLYGRADDQIMLSTGEKTNPVPLERILVQDPHIQAAVIFGTGKLQNGVVIDPKKEHGFDTHDVTEVERFREMIWPTIERLNAFAPQHSRIFKETIIFSSPDKPFTYTGKGTARRQAIINEYQPEIEAMFEAIAISSHSEVDLPSSWSKTETLRFIRNVVHTVLERDIADDADIFQFGGDSLQASWIYNQVARALRETSGETSPCSNLKSNCVYQAPSIALLSRLIYDLVNPTSEDEAETKYTETQRLHDLVSHYTSDFPARPETLRESIATKDAVLVTGTTGGLGCHILMHLLSDSSVGTVYALNRPSATFERQVQAFQSNGLDADCLNLPKLRFIRGDLCEKSFGLEASVFEEIRDSITHIIHNAWKVDFNHSVTSFLSLLGGMRALVNLCLASPYVQPPRLLFTSSVGVFRQYDGPTYALEEPIEDPSVVAGTGYSESKWIGERILAAASEKAGLCAASVRVGQICGGVNGNWNEREWFPSVVKSAQYVGCLPDVEGDVSWIPSYNAALALVQMRTSDESILHLAHPRPVAWRTFMQAIAQRMRVPLVPYSAWLAALEQSQRDSQLSDLGKLNHNPALRLLDFFREAEATAEKEPLGCIHMATSKAELAAPALGLPELGLEWVERWMHVWQESGFIDTPQDA